MRGARTLAWIAAAGCWALGAPGYAKAATFVDDNPAAASRGPGQVELFVSGRGDSLLRSALTASGTWTPWTTLDGTLSSGPAAESDGTNTDVFVRGTDSQIYGRAEVGTTWMGWGALGGPALSAPATSARQGTPYVDVYVRWADNTIKLDTWTGSAWSGFMDVPGGGLTISAPATVSRAPGVTDVFVRGTDDGVYEQTWNGSAWGGWAALGGTTTAAPAVVSRATNTMDLFVRGTDGQIHWRTFNGANWSPYVTLRGGVGSGPAAVTDGSGRIYLFARSGGDVAVDVFNGAGWSGWRPTHPRPALPAARCSFAAGHMSIKTHTVDFGKRPRLSGRVVTAAGRPVPGGRLLVRSGGVLYQATHVATASGAYRLTLSRGHNRKVQVMVPVPARHAYICSKVITVRVRAGVTLSASRRVRPGGTVRFHGRLLGGPLPRHGKVVELQAFDHGQWRTFASARARGKSRAFRASYHLTQTFGPRTFRFRVRVRREADYPYVLGYSRSVKVRVT